MHVQIVKGQENAHFAMGILFLSTHRSSGENFFAIVGNLQYFSAAMGKQLHSAPAPPFRRYLYHHLMPMH